MSATIGTFEIERTVPMNMYSLSKGRCCVISVIGLLLAITVLIVGFLGPPIFVIKVAPSNVSSRSILGEANVYTEIFNAPSFSNFNRQLMFKVRAHTKESQNGGAVTIPVNITMRVNIVDSKNMSVTGVTYLSRWLETSRSMYCSAGGECDALDLVRFVRLPDGPVNLEVKLSSFTPMESLTFEMLTFNTEFTNFELWLRVVLVFFAFILICWFMHSMRRFPLIEWNLEQIWMAILLVFLLPYNDPTFGLLLIKSPSNGIQWPIADLISYGFRTFYIAILLIFWLTVFHGIRESSRPFCRFYIIKFLLVLPLWLLVVCVYGWSMFTYSITPETDPVVINASLSPLLITLGCVFGVYLTILLYHFLRSCIEVCRMSYLNVRLCYAACLSIGLMLMIVGICFSTLAVPEWHVLFYDPVLFFYSSPFLGLGLPVLLNAHAALSACLYGPAIPKSLRNDTAPLVMSAGSDGEDSDEEVVYDMKSKRIPEFVPAQRVDRSFKSRQFQK